MRLAGRVFSQQLDRSKPLWEMWLVQGLERDRFAILTKTHHAAVDGISGVDIGTVLFDLEPVPEPATAQDGWRPQPTPSGAKLVARGVSEAAGAPLRLAEQALDAVRHPDSAASRVTEALEGVGEVVGALADPAPNVPLNDPIGPHRRFVFTRSELATLKRIKDTLGGTVNDVVLAVVTGALRRWLHGRGIRTEGLELRALVPVSIRTEDERGDARQPADGDARAAARLPRGPGSAAAGGHPADGGPEALEAGAGRRSDLALQRLRADDAPRPGLAPQLLDPPVQPDRHQRARPADPALRPRARDGGGLPDRLPAPEPRAGGGDHQLQRARSGSACWRTTTRWRTSIAVAEGIDESLAELERAAIVLAGAVTPGL